MKFGFGVDLGGTTVKIAYFDETGTMLSKWEIPTDRAESGKNILPDIAAAIRSYLQDNAIDPAQIVGVGIGVPGAVLPDGTVNKCINLGWGVFNIEKELSALTGFPVKAGNDATVAAMGECWKGGGQGCKNMVFATLGTGVGGGIVIDGKAHTGHRNRRARHECVKDRITKIHVFTAKYTDSCFCWLILIRLHANYYLRRKRA